MAERIDTKRKTTITRRKKAPILISSQRFRERVYNPSQMRDLFKIPLDEMMIDLKWDKERNMIILETVIDFDKQ